jgi:hypothetical protein
MPSAIQRRNPNKGRPRKPIPPRPPLGLGVPEFSRRMNWSQQKTRRKIKQGKVRGIQLGPREVNFGCIKSLNELI